MADRLMRIWVAGVLLAAILVAAGPVMASGTGDDGAADMPSEASLIAAWEDIQKNDPKTTTFEKKGEGEYHFATERFPYDGRLNVLNITIEALPGSVMGESYYGVIEVELTDLPEDFFRKYAYSYSSWQKNNYLYYDANKGQWRTTTQWSATLAEEFDAGHAYGGGNNPYQMLFWLVALAVLLVVALLGIRQVRRAMTQQQTALDGQARALEMMEKSHEMAAENLKIQKENTKILKSILKSLEGS